MPSKEILQQHQLVRVTFELPREVEGSIVHLVGDFTGWEGVPMKRSDDGGWTTTVDLAPGRSFEFRYLVDGERWENDWDADRYVRSPFGHDNSVVDTPALEAPGMAAEHAATGRTGARPATGAGARPAAGAGARTAAGAAAGKPAAKKAAAKKATTRKTSVKKAAAGKPVPKEAAAKKPTPGKATAKKAAPKKPTARKAPTKTPTAKDAATQLASKPSAARKPSPEGSAAQKPAPGGDTVRKSSEESGRSERRDDAREGR